MYFLIVMLSSLLHEAGHLLAICCFGGRADISLCPSGFVIKRSGGAISYFADSVISLSGPFVNLLLFLLFKSSENNILSMLSLFSGALGAINLLPISFLDGGRALEAIISRIHSPEKAVWILKICSNIFMGMFFVLSICLALTQSSNLTLFLMWAWLFYNINIKKPKNS